MKILFPLCLLLFLHGCTESGDAPASTDAQKLDLSGFEVSDIPGTDMKLATRRGEDGLLKEHGIISNGMRFGNWTVFQESKEVPKSVANYVEGKLTGVYMEFNPQGQVELVCNYSENQLDGKFTRYRLGRKTEEGAYKNGQYEGAFRKYFKGLDLLQQESEYKAGQLDGLTRYYNENGDVILEYEYKNGEQVRGGIVESNTSAGE